VKSKIKSVVKKGSRKKGIRTGTGTGIGIGIRIGKRTRNGNGLEVRFDQNWNSIYNQNQNCIHSPKLDLKFGFFDEK
jgi:ribosomal protein L14